MKLVIPTHNRAELITTPFLDVFADFDKCIIFHSEEALKEYKKFKDYENIECVVTNIPASNDGTAKAKNIKYYLDNFVKDNEWVLFADDNVINVEGLITQSLWEENFLENKTANDFDLYDYKLFNKRFLEIVKHADEVGAKMVGFQTSKNWFYSHKKYRYRGYVLGKMYAWKKDNSFNYHLPFVPMEDFHFSAMHLVNYGLLLLCDYLWPNAVHFQGGGLGTRDERYDNHKYATKYLAKKYPQLLKKKNRPDDYPDLRFPYMSDDKFYYWRNKYIEFIKEYKFNDKAMSWEKIRI